MEDVRANLVTVRRMHGVMGQLLDMQEEHGMCIYTEIEIQIVTTAGRVDFEGTCIYDLFRALVQRVTTVKSLCRQMYETVGARDRDIIDRTREEVDYLESSATSVFVSKGRHF